MWKTSKSYNRMILYTKLPTVTVLGTFDRYMWWQPQRLINVHPLFVEPWVIGRIRRSLCFTNCALVKWRFWGECCRSRPGSGVCPKRQGPNPQLCLHVISTLIYFKCHALEPWTVSTHSWYSINSVEWKNKLVFVDIEILLKIANIKDHWLKGRKRRKFKSFKHPDGVQHLRGEISCPKCTRSYTLCLDPNLLIFKFFVAHSTDLHLLLADLYLM